MITNNIPIFPEDYEQVKQSEYHRINSDPKRYGETARIGFRYFKLKKKEKIIQDEFSDLTAEIKDNGWVVLSQGVSCISLGIYPNARFNIIKRLLAELELKKLEEKIKEWH